MQRARRLIASATRTTETLWLGVMLVMLGALFAAVAFSTTLARFDAHTNHEVSERATERGTDFNFMITHLGGTEWAITLTVLVVAVLAAIRHWRAALVVTVSVAMTQAVVQLVKVAVERPRPGAGLVEASGFSFPSAHAATSVALYIAVAFIAARACRNSAGRVVIAVAALGLVLAVGASRVYLGAHYPSDVVAGWLVGGILFLGSWIAVSRFRPLQALPG